MTEEVLILKIMDSPPSNAVGTVPDEGIITNSNSLLTKDAFSSERSQRLFEAINELQSCGANHDIELPEVSMLRMIWAQLLRLTRSARHCR